MNVLPPSYPPHLTSLPPNPQQSPNQLPQPWNQNQGNMALLPPGMLPPGMMAPHGSMVIYMAPPPAAPPVAPPGPVVSLEDVLRCVGRHWKLSALVAGLLAALVTFFLLGRVPEYSSSATLLMQAKENKVFGFEKVVDNNGEVNESPTLMNNHRVQMKSRKFHEYLFSHMDPAVLQAAVAAPAKVPLAVSLQEKVGALLARKSEVPETAPVSPEKALEKQFHGFMEGVKVDYVKETYILQVTVTHHQAETAAQVANDFIRLYERYTASEDNAVVKEAVAFQRKEAEALQIKVQNEEAALASYLKEKGLVGDDAMGGAAGEKLKQLGGEIAKNEVELTKANEVLSLVAYAREDTQRLLAIEAIANHPAVSGLRLAWVEKQREKESVDLVFLPKHPKYVDFHRQYDAVATELKRGLGQAVADHQNRVQSLRNQQKTLQERLRADETAVLGLGQDSVKRNELKRQLDADRDTLSKLMGRLNEASVSSDFNRTTHLRIADVAVPAPKPTSPNKPLALVLGGFTFAGIFCTFPLALAVIGLLRTHGIIGALRTAQGRPAVEAPSLPVVTTPLPVPVVAPAALTVASEPLGILGKVPLLPASERNHQALVKTFREKSSTAEGFQLLSRALQASAGASQRILIVSSVQPHEGKSHLAAGLAAASAMEGHKTLLIDCHLRQPAQQTWLPQGPEVPGLKQLLQSGESVLDLNSIRYGRSDLFVLQTGGAQPEPYFFSTSGFAEVLKTFAQQVDIVILDAPCLQETSEIAGLFPHADRVVLAWNAALTGREHLQWGVDFVRSQGGRLGVEAVECV